MADDCHEITCLPRLSSTKSDAPTEPDKRRLSNQPKMENDDQCGKCEREDHARDSV
jgi:hypothetical protein